MSFHTEQYKGFEIVIDQDQNADNPLLWDGKNQAVVVHALSSKPTYYGDATLYCPKLTREIIKTKGKELAKIFGYSSLLRLYKDFGCWEWQKYGTVDAIQSGIDAHLYGRNYSNCLKTLESLYNLVGIPAKHYFMQGHRQWDWFDLFITYAEPDYIGDIDTLLDSYAKLYKNWSGGDVWYYHITELDTGQGGYYAEYESNEWQDMLKCAKDHIDSHIAERDKERQYARQFYGHVV